MPQISPKRLYELETENAGLREELAALKANRLRAFTTKELTANADAIYLRYANDRLTAGSLQEEMEREIARREGD